MDKFFKAIEERAILYYDIVRADFVAVFADSKGNETYTSFDFLSKASVAPGVERNQLNNNGITMFQIERAHKQFAYENVRLDVANKERNRASKDFLLSSKNIFSQNIQMLGTPSFDRQLMGYKEASTKKVAQSISATLDYFVNPGKVARTLVLYL